MPIAWTGRDELLRPRDEALLRRRPLKVLVVEDDRDLLRTISEVLAECGFDARAASSVEEAIAELERASPPECVLLDLCLPHLSGYELLVRLERDERWRGIAVAAMTAYPAEAFLPVGLADAFLPKPFTLDALEGLVTLLCSSARHDPARGDSCLPPGML
jgi:CheY-like chemotaxis protein